MDKIILGLLMTESRTVYELRSEIERSMSMMYSGSFGSIQNAVKKLLALGFIEFKEVVENGKYKKIYSVAPAGEKEFENWVSEPMRPGQTKNQDMAKLYFMGLSDPNTRRERIEKYLAALWKTYFELKATYDEAAAAQDKSSAKRFMLVSEKYNVDSLAFEIEWYEGLLADIDGM